VLKQEPSAKKRGMIVPKDKSSWKPKASAEAAKLWTEFKALRAAIRGYLHDGVPETDPRILQARQQQRRVAERMVKIGAARGISFQREGDLSIEQHQGNRTIIVPPLAESDQPSPRIVKLDTLYIDARQPDLDGSKGHGDPSGLAGTDALRRENQVASRLGRPLAHIEGVLGVDYELKRDDDLGITYYVPLGGD